VLLTFFRFSFLVVAASPHYCNNNQQVVGNVVFEIASGLGWELVVEKNASALERESLHMHLSGRLVILGWQFSFFLSVLQWIQIANAIHYRLLRGNYSIRR
jgi:hypothetical protein